jgi:methyl-accepting chemotaxis protein
MNPLMHIGLTQRLVALTTALILALAGVATMAWIKLTDVQDTAWKARSDRVSQLDAMAASELELTRASLQLRHAMLARSTAERDEALADVAAKRANIAATLQAYDKRIFSDGARTRFAQLTPLLDAFWGLAQTNVALIRDGRTQEAFAYLVDTTIPARNAVLKAMEDSVRYQRDALGQDIQRIQDGIQATLTALLAVVLLVAGGQVGFAWHLAARLRLRVAASQAVAERVRDGDLTTPVAIGQRDEFAPLLGAMSDMQQSLARVVADVRTGAEQVATASAQIAQGNQDLSQRTEQQASSLQQTASSMEQLGSTVSQNADNARQASQLATGASAVAAKGGAVVEQVVSTMKEIDQSSKKIADIIGVIDSIAFQTNILALNAAVEAARAGEQGRGFAVVAGEVRNLAQRSAEAAREIKGLIGTSVDRVEQGSQLVDQAGTTMREIVGAIGRVTDIMGEISAASEEQKAGVNQVGSAVSQMDQATQHNAALVEQSAAAATSMREQAALLVQSVSVFRVGHNPTAAPALRPVTAVAARPEAPRRASASSGPPARPAAPAALATAGQDDWETF